MIFRKRKAIVPSSELGRFSFYKNRPFLSPYSYFTKGYTAFTCAELLSYNYRHPHDGDFNFLDENGANGDLENGLFLAWSGYNFYRISLFKEEMK